MSPFITGSRAYGVSREDSDIDLVILIGQKEMERLAELAGNDENSINLYGGVDDSPCGQIKFGKLNLIMVSSRKDYDIWKDGTDELIAKAPVTRDRAVALFKHKRECARAWEEEIRKIERGDESLRSDSDEIWG